MPPATSPARAITARPTGLANAALIANPKPFTSTAVASAATPAETQAIFHAIMAARLAPQAMPASAFPAKEKAPPKRRPVTASPRPTAVVSFIAVVLSAQTPRHTSIAAESVYTTPLTATAAESIPPSAADTFRTVFTVSLLLRTYSPAAKAKSPRYVAPSRIGPKN